MLSELVVGEVGSIRSADVAARNMAGGRYVLKKSMAGVGDMAS